MLALPFTSSEILYYYMVPDSDNKTVINLYMTPNWSTKDNRLYGYQVIQGFTAATGVINDASFKSLFDRSIQSTIITAMV